MAVLLAAGQVLAVEQAVAQMVCTVVSKQSVLSQPSACSKASGMLGVRLRAMRIIGW